MRNYPHDNEDEFLENAWYILESGELTKEAIKKKFGDEGFENILEVLTEKGAISANGSMVELTEEGNKRAAGIVRRHRLAERLMSDALGMEPDEMERGACEFEHVVAPEISDSICTLLGHPRVCPHGMAIPEGNCCREAKKSIEIGVCPVTQILPGQTAKVAYVNTNSEIRMKKLLLMGVTPDAKIKLAQIHPAVVLEVGDSQVAMDKGVAEDIFVWRPTT